MPLEPIRNLLGKAKDARYAVGYFESWNIESLHGVIDAAEKTRSPVIIGFNGEFLSRPGRIAREQVSWYGALGKAAAESASVPCGLVLNECAKDDCVRAAIGAGFNLVMPADPAASCKDYERRVARLAAYAHEHGVAVEAAVGELPHGSAGHVEQDGGLTDPALAEAFVKATSIDLLAVSVGNVHIMVRGEQELNLDHLDRVRRRVPAYIGLHGGTGIAADSLQKAVSMGVVNVAYGTYLKQRYLAAVRAALGIERPPSHEASTKQVGGGGANPHELLGIGGPQDVMVAGRFAVRDAVLERIELLGCCGRAQ